MKHSRDIRGCPTSIGLQEHPFLCYSLQQDTLDKLKGGSEGICPLLNYLHDVPKMSLVPFASFFPKHDNIWFYFGGQSLLSAQTKKNQETSRESQLFICCLQNKPALKVNSEL